MLERMHVPLVVLGQQFPGCCSVYHDDFGAAQAATAHMLAKGRHAPGYIGVTLLDKAAGQQRRAGFEAAVKDAGLSVRPQRMAVAKFSTASGYEQAARLLGLSRPTLLARMDKYGLKVETRISDNAG